MESVDAARIHVAETLERAKHTGAGGSRISGRDVIAIANDILRNQTL